MPHRYEVLRDKFIEQGMTEAAAKTKAAKIFNSTRKKGENPVTGQSDAGSRKKIGIKRGS